ncbi:MCP four helix bundle domain-containing protein [Pedobacter mucosus]|uniref:MCP four helix bundle domain-containing protein n=1 Tax=Pedobacter mucosus TaxID=2895286 RepID=UPI001EE40FFD|nr:MCP four helix bundle domain-containing protein [Pedobacter mucosus]UKT66061.1 MCP four helix bundle domain-containing protein [Pedobacter mucosus]
MKISFSFKSKLKIAFFLFAIMCCTLLIRFLEDKSVEKINTSFISMYNDRLVPATDLYFIAENLYQKKSILENAHLSSQEIHANRLSDQLLTHNRKIDSIINKFELTFLVKQEKDFLADLKNALAIQKIIEAKLVAMVGVERKENYNVVGRNASLKSLERLSALVKIQSKVGDKLVTDSKVFVLGTKIYSTFQIVLAIAIGILIVGIVSASNAVKIKNDKYNLN